MQRLPGIIKTIKVMLIIGALYFIISYIVCFYYANDIVSDSTINSEKCGIDRNESKFTPKPENWCKGRNKFEIAYGQSLHPPIYSSFWRPNYNKDPNKAIHRAFGCSMNKKYCQGKIQSIPCCTKILYDIWYKLDEYLTKHGVDYSLRWGSLLFAIRNGMHCPWDARDVDIGFLRPRDNATRAIEEFVSQYKVFQVGPHLVGSEHFYRSFARKTHFIYNCNHWHFFFTTRSTDS